MTREQLIAALQLAADAMRRADPGHCASHQVEQVTDAEWDQALALAENALDNVST